MPSPRLLTLLYHGVIPEQRGIPCDELDVVYQEEFERHLKALRRHFRILHGDEAADLITRRRELPRRAALVSLDDGLQNLLDHALPVAEALRVPILAFVTTAHLDQGEWLWFGRFHAHRLNDGPGWREFGDGYGDLSFLRWGPWLDRIGAPRREEGTSLQRLLFDGMRTGDLARAVSRGWLAVGGHTVNHPRLVNEDPLEVRRELVDCRAQLERIVGRPVRLFAYPEGRLDGRVARAVRDAGYAAAFAVRDVPPDFPRDLDAYRLPRVPIHRPGALRFRLKCSAAEEWRRKLRSLAKSLRPRWAS